MGILLQELCVLPDGRDVMDAFAPFDAAEEGILLVLGEVMSRGGPEEQNDPPEMLLIISIRLLFGSRSCCGRQESDES
jgi:hypothetical protein